MELGGRWRARELDPDLQRHFAEPGLDDACWDEVAVPGHWRSSPAFAASDGPLAYRHRFAAPRPAEGERAWLELGGVFYSADVWLDGGYVGDAEGYFVPHTYEVTDALRTAEEHVLAVATACARPSDLAAKRQITGVFQHWDCSDPAWNPGGLWRPVRVVTTGPVRIAGLRVLCTEAEEGRGQLTLRAELDAVDAARVVLRTTVGALTDHVQERPLAAGGNRVEWTVAVPDPPLWWPRALGDQPLVDVAVTVEVDGDRSDSRCVRTGFRRVGMKGWVLSVNGERLFLKGTNQGPSRMALANAGGDELRADVDRIVATGLDLVRLHGHVSRPELYDACDEAGLLVWQDFPLQWGYARGIRKAAARQARSAVDLLGHHPSVALWCGHNEPFALALEQGVPLSRKMARRYVVAQQLPGWNKTVLDRSVRRAFEGADGTRPVVAHSGVLPHLPQLDGTDSHLYHGWYHGQLEDLAPALARWPRLARFVSEFGAQAVPVDAAFCEPERWPDLDWEHLGRTHGLQRWVFDRVVPPDAHLDFDTWRAATQRYQAELLKHHVETLRRLKYRPTGGFCTFSFADATDHPAVTWSVLGHDRQPKPAWEALRDACRPVIVVADRPPAVVEPGDALALDVHVVSDLRTPIEAAEVTAVVRWPGGEHRQRWQGDIGADACLRVGTLQVVVPDVAGDLEVELRLSAPTGPGAGGLGVTNVYRSRMRTSPPEMGV